MSNCMTISFLACVVGRRAFFTLAEKSSFLMLVSKFLVDRLLMSDKLLLLIFCNLHANLVLVDKKHDNYCSSYLRDHESSSIDR